MPAIVVTDLQKTYRFHRKEPGLLGSLKSFVRRQTLETRAVDGVSFQIEGGEVVGFLGPNGAGKTTTLKMLCGLLYPSAGSATVLGYVPQCREHDFLRRIALVMGQKNVLSWDIAAYETLLLMKEIYAIPAAEFHRRVDELAGMLDVERLLRVQVRKLSLGERMKMELFASLLHRPAVLFLDEPTIGLDVVSQQRVRDFLRTLNREHGTTILLTSHYMDDIEQLCPRVLVIDRGHLLFDGPLASLARKAAPHKVITAVFVEPVADETLVATLGVYERRAGDDPLRVSLAVPRQDVATVAGRLLSLGTVADLLIEEVPVEEIIRDMFSARALEAQPQ